jgi:hypothetical protein
MAIGPCTKVYTREQADAVGLLAIFDTAEFMALHTGGGYNANGGSSPFSTRHDDGLKHDVWCSGSISGKLMRRSKAAFWRLPVLSRREAYAAAAAWCVIGAVVASLIV